MDLLASFNVSQTASSIASLQAAVVAMKLSLNDFFLCVASMIIYFMQAGFAFLEAGSVRSKNVTNILIKNALDSFIGAIAYYIFGYALGYGDPSNGFCGERYWALSGLPSANYSHVLFNFMFAATASTIVSGAVAERCEFVSYLFYSAGITGILYPIVSHWVWSPHGWLRRGISVTFNDGVAAKAQFMDFAGSGVVHLVGGTASIAAAAFLGPRIGRFDAPNRPAEEIRGHSVPLVSLGAFVLLFGFLAFNGGSQGSISAPGDGQAVALAMVNTVLCGSSSAVVTLGIAKFRHKTWSLLSIINGALAGMVAICAGCNSIHPWGALIIGVLASLSYTGWSSLMVRLKIDDPLEAVGVHFGGGLLGVFSVPFLNFNRGILINPSRESGIDLLWQLAGAAAIMAWSGGIAVIMFGSLKAAGWLRVCEEFETKGLDIPKHGEPAYPLVAYGHGWGDHVPAELSLSGIESYTRRRASEAEVQTDANNHAAKKQRINNQHKHRHLHNDKRLPEVAVAIGSGEENNGVARAAAHENGGFEMAEL